MLTCVCGFVWFGLLVVRLGLGWFACWWWCALFLAVVKLDYCSCGSLVGTWDWLGVH